MNKKYIIANWKMAPSTLAEAGQILDSVNDYLETKLETRQGLVDQALPGIVVCPPFVFLEEVSKLLQTSHLDHNAQLGAQDIFWEDKGADTGEISGPMLNKLGVKYVIVGHSERRWKLGESGEVVNKKLKAVLRNEMIPIVCIGERSREGDWHAELWLQVSATFRDLTAEDLSKCLIAYEPIWAISSNPGAKPDTPESSLEAIRFVQTAIEDTRSGNIETKFLYGGSVTSRNVADFINQKEIEGVLVGSASVNKEEFVKILGQV